MRVAFPLAQLIASLTGATNGRRKAGRRAPARRGKKYGAATTALTLIVSWMMIQPGVALGVQVVKKSTQVTVKPAIPVSPQPTKPTTQTVVKPVQPRPPGGGPVGGGPSSGNAGATYYPSSQMISVAPPVNFRALAKQEALEPTHDVPSEIKSINPPKGDRPEHHFGTITPPSGGVTSVGEEPSPSAPPASATGPSPGPTKTFKGEFLSGTTIPPDTMGAVGKLFVVTSTNDRLRIQTRDGVELSRVTINSFWSTATVKGVPVASAFDTKVYFDRFNSHFILVSSLNGPGINSGAGFAVTQTADPTGLWNRYTVASDPTSTASAGHAIDYPSVGFNKNWIVVDENTFNYSGTSFTSFYGTQIYVLDKAAAYAGTLSSVSLFEGPFATNCAAETDLGCGFTMAPAITEDITTDTEYMVEDWDSTAAQLRMSKMTGTPSAPVITVGTQFP